MNSNTTAQAAPAERKKEMIFPLESLIKFDGNIYEITVAANKRAYQMSKVEEERIAESYGKAVSLAAEEIFSKEAIYRIVDET